MLRLYGLFFLLLSGNPTVLLGGGCPSAPATGGSGSGYPLQVRPSHGDMACHVPAPRASGFPLLSLSRASSFAEIPPAYGTFTLSPEIKQAYTALFRLRLDDALQLIEADKKQHPGNAFHLLLEDYRDFLKLLIGQDPQFYKTALARRAKRLSYLGLADQTSPFYHYTHAEIYLHWAMIRFRFGEQVRGANELRKSMASLEKNNRKFPGFQLNKKGLGMVHAMAGAIPASYTWLAGLAGITGTVEQGITELQQLEQWLQHDATYRFLLPEVLFIHSFISRNLATGRQHPEPDLAPWLRDEPLLQFAAASSAQKRQDARAVWNILASTPVEYPGLRFCYIDYLRGEALLNRLDTSATGYLQHFISCTGSGAYVRAAYRKWAWSELLRGRTQRYHELMQQAAAATLSIETDDDRQAALEAAVGKAPRVNLLKARLLFDGGSYPDAIRILLREREEIKTGGILAERVELNYRLARCYHQTGNSRLAELLYKAAIAEGSRLNEYFSASSAYHLGLLYEEKGDPQQAFQFYNKVAQFPEHPYKTSLDAKAKAALKRME